MKTKQQLLAELFTTCLELNDEHFTVFFDHQAHVHWIDIRVCALGYNENPSWGKQYNIYSNERFNSQACQSIIDQLHQLKAESIAERDRLEKDVEYKKQKRKEELLRELKQLEGNK